MTLTRQLRVDCLRHVDSTLAVLMVIAIMVPGLLLADFSLKSINTDPWFLNNYHIAMKCGDLSLPFRYPGLYLRSIGELLLVLVTIFCLSLPLLLTQILRSFITELRWKLLGSRRFFSTSSMSMIHKDSFGELYELQISDYKMIMLQVKNSTPDSDGRTREFVLRVPPHMRTAREAVAWTFQLAPEDYCPTSES